MSVNNKTSDSNHLTACEQPKKDDLIMADGHLDVETEPVRAWVTLVSVILVLALCEYSYVTFPVLYPAVTIEYDASSEDIGFSYMISSVAYGIGGIVAAPMIDWFECKRSAFVAVFIYFTGYFLSAFSPTLIGFQLAYGIGAGLGYGALQTCAVTLVQKVFTKNRNLATALCFLGPSLAQMFGPSFVEFTLRNYGFQGSFMLQAGLQAQGFVLVMLFTDPQVNENTPSESSDRENSGKLSVCQQIDHHLGISLLKNPLFLGFACLRVLWLSAQDAVLLYSVSTARHYGIASKQADTLPSYLSISSTIFGFTFISLSTKRYFSIHLYFLLGILALNAGSFLPLIKAYHSLVIAMVLVGVCEGTSSPACPLLITDIVGVDDIARGWALLEIASVLAAYFGGPFAGWLFDSTGSYWAVYVFAGAMATSCSSLSVIVVSVLMHRKSKRKSYDQLTRD